MLYSELIINFGISFRTLLKSAKFSSLSKSYANDLMVLAYNQVLKINSHIPNLSFYHNVHITMNKANSDALFQLTI